MVQIELRFKTMLNLVIIVRSNRFEGTFSIVDHIHLVLYGLVLLMTFLVNPFLFFYYEEKVYW